MSLMALVAAMRPKSNGSSTMGMKKSVVDTTPRSSSSAYTAASSRDALPTHRRGSRFWAPLPARITSSTLGLILQPQPAPWLYWVRRMGVLGKAMPGGVSGEVMAALSRIGGPLPLQDRKNTRACPHHLFCGGGPGGGAPRGAPGRSRYGAQHVAGQAAGVSSDTPPM